MDLARLADPDLLGLLVEDGALKLKVKVRADYTLGLTKFRSDESIEYPWTAPLALLHDLLTGGNLSGATEDILGWAGPIVREWISAAVIDAAMAEGEWRRSDLGGWADLEYRMWLNETTGEGGLDMALRGSVAGFDWSVNGTVPLRIVDGSVFLKHELDQEVVSDVA
jgi:hypothetical protein